MFGVRKIFFLNKFNKTQLFSAVNNSILEWFLKGHLTLKTGVMAAKKFDQIY